MLVCICVFCGIAGAQSYYYGVNLSCAEFGSSNIPGVYGKDYTYPSPNSFNYYKNNGLTLIRLPFLWERLQPALNGAIDASELGRIDTVVAGARTRGMKVILDPHNYARRSVSGVGYVIGTSQVPVSAFADFWKKVADHFKNETALWAYGLMNEPHDVGAYSWFASAQAAIDSIRTVDMTHAILVPGNDWCSGDRWPISSDTMKNIRDPANNVVFEAHQYFDSDASGTYAQTYDASGATPTIGVNRIKHFVDWCAQNKKRGFVGEYGIPGNDARWNAVLDNFLSYLNSNAIGGTYWAGGPWWGSYALSVEPANNTDKPQMAILKKYSGGTVQIGQPTPSARLSEKSRITVVLQSRRGRNTISVSLPAGSALDRCSLYSVHGRCITVFAASPESNSVVWLKDAKTAAFLVPGTYILSIGGPGLAMAKTIMIE